MNALPYNDQLLAQLFDAQPQPIFWTTPVWDEAQKEIIDFRYDYCNEEMVRYATINGSQLVGRTLSENPALEKPLREKFIRQMTEVYRTGQTLEDAVINTVLNKNYSFLRTRILNGVLTIIQDRTLEYHSIRQLEQKNQLLDSLLKYSSSGISVTEVIRNEEGKVIDGRTILANDAAARFVGIPKEDYLGKTAREIDPQIMESTLHQMSLNTLATGEPFHTQYFLEPTRRWLELSVSRMDEDHLINIFTDVTETKEAQLKVEQAMARMKSVIDASQSGMFVFSPVFDESGEVVNFRFVLTNAAFAAYVNQTPEILEGRLGSDFFPGYLTNGVFDMYKDTYLNGGYRRKDVHYHVDGLDLYLDILSTKVDQNVLVTFTDFTALHKAQLELERSVSELKRTNTNLEEFAYAASHDLKEPIRKVHFFADRLKTRLEGKLDDEDRRILSRMEQATLRMSNLVDDLLEYSYVSAGAHKWEKIDLNEKISMVLSDLELLISEKKAVIRVHPLPVVRGHRRQLQQIFQNLLINALRYSKPEVPPAIHVKCARIEGTGITLELTAEEKMVDYYEISVSDNGIGFDQEDAEKIFQIFQRLHGNAEFRGTGIGLAIVRKAAQNHGGFITAEGRRGQGATFRVYLPLHHDD